MQVPIGFDSQHFREIRVSIVMPPLSESVLWPAFYMFNTLRPRQNGRHFADDIFNAFSGMKIYNFRLKFHWKGPINNIPALVQIMAWCWWSNKPLSEPMMVTLRTHLYITWPQWVKLWIPMNVLIQVNWNGVFDNNHYHSNIEMRQ